MKTFIPKLILASACATFLAASAPAERPNPGDSRHPDPRGHEQYYSHHRSLGDHCRPPQRDPNVVVWGTYAPPAPAYWCYPPPPPRPYPPCPPCPPQPPPPPVVYYPPPPPPPPPVVCYPFYPGFNIVLKF